MNDDELLGLIHDYLEPPGEPNPELAGVQIVWEEGHPGYGARHMWEEHGVRVEEVEEVLFEVPPYVQAKRHPDFPGRTLFWGASRHDRWLFIVCEEWSEGGVRFLKPITAFEPKDGALYWEKYQ